MSADSTSANAATDERARLEALVETHGASVHRYCAAMLGAFEAREMVPRIFGDVLEHEGHPAASSDETVVVHAVAHNRCVERTRNGGRAPGGQGIAEPHEAVAVQSVARLRPLGRDAFVLRQALGLRSSQIEGVCGVSAAGAVRRVCRAWRIAVFHAASGGHGQGPVPNKRPAGETLGDDPQQWAAIREDAERFVRLRAAYRRAVLRHEAPEGQAERVWAAIERARRETQQREDERADREAIREAQRLAAEVEAEHARAEAAKADAESERVTAKAEAGGGFDAATDEDQAEAESPPVRGMPWRYIMLGVALVAAGVVARWIAAFF